MTPKSTDEILLELTRDVLGLATHVGRLNKDVRDLTRQVNDINNRLDSLWTHMQFMVTAIVATALIVLGLTIYIDWKGVL